MQYTTKFLNTVGDRQVKVIASDGTIDRLGDILVPWGVELDEYRRNPVVLAQHDNAAPIARCSYIGVENAAVVATIDFPPAGTSEESDRYLRLVKSGVISAVSVGFLPLEMEPIRTGWKYQKWELLELSCVSVPANANALVVERSGSDRSTASRFPSVLDFAGTLAQRKSQLEFQLRHSSEAEARRERIAGAYRKLYGTE